MWSLNCYRRVLPRLRIFLEGPLGVDKYQWKKSNFDTILYYIFLPHQSKSTSSHTSCLHISQGIMVTSSGRLPSVPFAIWAFAIPNGSSAGLNGISLHILKDLTPIDNFSIFPKTLPRDLIILGSSLGPKSQADLLEKKIIESKNVNGIIEKLNAHYGFFMLKNCFSLPKLLYFQRTSPCFNHPAL